MYKVKLLCYPLCDTRGVTRQGYPGLILEPTVYSLFFFDTYHSSQLTRWLTISHHRARTWITPCALPPYNLFLQDSSHILLCLPSRHFLWGFPAICLDKFRVSLLRTDTSAHRCSLNFSALNYVVRFNLEGAHFVACTTTHVMLVLSLAYVILRVAHVILFLSRRQN